MRITADLSIETLQARREWQDILKVVKGNSHPSPRNPESPKQDKPKAKHPNTHINQINEDQTQQILKAAREKQQIIHKRIPIRITADLSTETLQARREWQDILKVMKENNLEPRLVSQQGSHSNMKEKSKALQTSKS